MTSKERAAMQQALEALEEMFHSNSTKVAVEKYNTAITAMREALDHSGEAIDMVAEQAEQEPVGEMIDKAGYKGAAWYLEPPATGIKLYAAPVRTKDLTEYELDELRFQNLNYLDYARAVIAADREKNNV